MVSTIAACLLAATMNRTSTRHAQTLSSACRVDNMGRRGMPQRHVNGSERLRGFGSIVIEGVRNEGARGTRTGIAGVNMSTWTVQVTISTANRVDTSTVTAILADGTACLAIMCSPGVPGISVLLGVEATTDAGAYRAAIVLLVAEVLPWLEEPTLTDVHIHTSKHPLRDTESPSSGGSAIVEGGTALVGNVLL